jgi:predicted  nucleic acid-binding Zn-ribbon protein
VTPRLDALLALQDVDTAVDQRRHRRANLPERTELAAIDREVAQIDVAHAEVSATRDEVAGRQAALEAELAATEQRAASVNRRLYGGEVSASRELQALSADVDALKARASALEDQVLETMEEREPSEARLAEFSGQLAGLAARRQEAAAGLAQAQAAIDAELEELESRRAEVARSVPEELQATYDRLRARLGGVAVARLVGSRCDGCHLTLPAMELDRIRHLADSEPVTCEQCGRILVRG